MTAYEALFRTTAVRLLVFSSVMIFAVLVSGWWVLPAVAGSLGILELLSLRERRATVDTGRRVHDLVVRARPGSDHTARLVFSLAGSYIVTGSQFQTLTPAQQDAVLLHEVGHHATVPHIDQLGYVVLMATLIFHTPLTSSSPLILLGVLLAAILASKAVNRLSETGADAFAAQDPDVARHLAQALETLVPEQHMRMRLHTSLLIDHPRPADRIRRLRAWSAACRTCDHE